MCPIIFHLVHSSRIFEILPSRVAQWKATPCVSELKNKEQLEKIRKQQRDLRAQLEELDAKHSEIDALIERAKQATIVGEEEVGFTGWLRVGGEV